METVHEGGCLCGAVRYKTTAEPQRVTVCHCTFCQRFTGTAFLVEPIFRSVDVAFSGKEPRTYDHQSDGSNKRVTLHFCGTCGTTVFLDLERFPDILGLCGGTFDDPNWFDRSLRKVSEHIHTIYSRRGGTAAGHRNLRGPCHANRRIVQPARRFRSCCDGKTKFVRDINFLGPSHSARRQHRQRKRPPFAAQLEGPRHARGSKVTQLSMLSPGASTRMPVPGTPRAKWLMASAMLLTGSTQK